MLNYIKEQHTKGFTPEEIRSKLLNAGWEQKTVDKYLMQAIQKEAKFEESAEFVELFARYGKFLIEGEEIQFKFDIALYHLVITSRRLILLRKFPKELIEFNLVDIELVEYYTNVKFHKGIMAAGYLFGSLIFAVNQELLWNRLGLILPIAERVLTTEFLMGMNLLGFSILAYALAMGVIDLTNFILSFVGRVRIMPRGIGPTDIITPMNDEVEKFIQAMQEHMGVQTKR